MPSNSLFTVDLAPEDVNGNEETRVVDDFSEIGEWDMVSKVTNVSHQEEFLQGDEEKHGESEQFVETNVRDENKLEKIVEENSQEHVEECELEEEKNEGNIEEASVYSKISNITSLIPLKEEILKETVEEVVQDVVKKVNEVVDHARVSSVILNETSTRRNSEGESEIGSYVAPTQRSLKGFAQEKMSMSETEFSMEGFEPKERSHTMDEIVEINELLKKSITNEISLSDLVLQATSIFGEITTKILGLLEENNKELPWMKDFAQEGTHSFLKILENEGKDPMIIRSLQKFFSSGEFADFMNDVCCNERFTTNRFQLSETFYRHLPHLLTPLGSLLQEQPSLLKALPILLKQGLALAEEEDKHESQGMVLHECACDGCSNDEDAKCDSISKGSVVNNNIQGVRYQSAINVEFNLCSTCEASGKYDAEYGPFLKLKSKEQTPTELIYIKGSMEKEKPDNASYSSDEDSTITHRKFSVLEMEEEKVREEKSTPVVLRCPYKQHEMKEFCVTSSLFCCDACNRRPALRSIMFGCRLCDWDLCLPCVQRNYAHIDFMLQQSRTVSGTWYVLREKDVLLKMEVVNDVRLEPSSIVKPGQALTKAWKVYNPSSWLEWPINVKLVQVGGDSCISREYKQCSVPPKSYGTLWFDFHAPTTLGYFATYWQLEANGARFGDILKLEFSVQQLHHQRRGHCHTSHRRKHRNEPILSI